MGSSEPTTSAPSSGAKSRWPWLAALAALTSIGAFYYLHYLHYLRGDSPEPPRPDFVEEPQSEIVIEAATEEQRWQTEEFASAADKQLKHLAYGVYHPGELEHPDHPLTELVVAGFQCTPLRPGERSETFADHVLTVTRGADAAPSLSHDGVAGVREAIAQLAAPFQDTEAYVKFKITSVEVADDHIMTDVVYQAAGRARDKSLQQSATWRCRWRPQADGPPQLEQITVREFEEAEGRGPSGTVFADCTRAVFRNADWFELQFSRGIDYWRTAIQSHYAAYPYGHHGIAMGDVNQDGLEDLYVCQPKGLPNRLLLQNPDGTVTDAAAEMGVDWLDRSRGALLLDFDNDGDEDLALALSELVVVFSNNGEGRFEERAIFRPAGDPGTLTAADYDADGDLDLYVVSYGQRFLADGESGGPVPYHDANNGGQNVLLRNDGEFHFNDVTAALGMDENNRRWSFAAGWEDYDNDGDLDLYVANDFGRNNLYRNDRGQFKDVAAEAGVEDIAAGMSVSWGDYNQDGNMDLYVGNMFSSAGLRIARQDRFQRGADPSDRSEFQRHARGNSLFLNQGDGSFRDVSESSRVTLGRWAWSSPFVDINNDGREDLIIANGFVTGSDLDDL